MNLKDLQEQQAAWSLKNFGPKYGSGYRQLLGCIEELGELAEVSEPNEYINKALSALGKLCHAHLKNEQNIRQQENHEARSKDAIADVIIYLCGYCTDQKWDLSMIVEGAWAEVSQRDWKKDPHTAHIGRGLDWNAVEK